MGHGKEPHAVTAKLLERCALRDAALDFLRVRYAGPADGVHAKVEKHRA